MDTVGNVRGKERHWGGGGQSRQKRYSLISLCRQNRRGGCEGKRQRKSD